MARGILCPNCDTFAPASAEVCPKCGTQLSANSAVDDSTIQSKKPRLSRPSIAQEATLEEQELPPPAATVEDSSMGVTVMDLDHVANTLDAAAESLPGDKVQLQFPAKVDPGKNASRRFVAPPSESAAPTTGSKRISALAQHQAALAAAAANPAPARKDPLVGEKLGEYVVEALIGKGGMGVVYRARQPQISSLVAIKVLRGDVISDKRDMERLLDEARVVNAIKHRGIINIFGAGELPDGRQYLVMEYLEGETLETRLERVGKFTTAEALPILDEVLAALAAAHGAGIVHRDLKPANVFLVKQSDGLDVVKLLDFGLARRQMQEVSRIAGTPDYISPEHARGRPAGPPADLYGFGILCFHLLTGQLPFTGNTPIEMMEKHVHHAPPVPAEVNPEISSAMSGMILALLEKDPAKRPDAAQAKLDLRGAARQLELASATPREGMPALTDEQLQLDPRMKELARKAGNAKMISLLGRYWPWVLAGLGVLWLVGVAIYLAVAPGPAAQISTPVPLPKKPVPVLPLAPLGPSKGPNVPTQVPAPVPVTAPPIEPEKVAPPVVAPPVVAPPVVAPPVATEVVPGDAAKPEPEKVDPKVALATWRREMTNKMMIQEGKLSGELSVFLSPLQQLQSEVEKVNTPEEQEQFGKKYEAFTQKVTHALERQ